MKTNENEALFASGVELSTRLGGTSGGLVHPSDILGAEPRVL